MEKYESLLIINLFMKDLDYPDWYKDEEWELKYFLPVFIVKRKVIIKELKENIEKEIKGKVNVKGGEVKDFEGEVTKKKSKHNVNMFDLFIFENNNEGVVRLKSDYNDIMKEYGKINNPLIEENKEKYESLRNYSIQVELTNIKNNDLYVNGTRYPHSTDIIPETYITVREMITPKKTRFWQYENLGQMKHNLEDENALHDIKL